MDETKYNETIADIAAALALVDKVSKLAHATYGYNGTKRACGYVIKELENLTERFSTEWERDKYELEEDLRLAGERTEREKGLAG